MQNSNNSQLSVGFKKKLSDLSKKTIPTTTWNSGKIVVGPQVSLFCDSIMGMYILGDFAFVLVYLVRMETLVLLCVTLS